MPIQDIPDWETAIQVATKRVLLPLIPDTDYTSNNSTGIPEPESFQEAAEIMGKALELLLISKNHKYGKGNILTATRFGMKVEQGLLLRENDKTERIINALTKGVELGKEGLTEGFGDKTGYGAIGVMLQRKTKNGKSWYELPIADV